MSEPTGNIADAVAEVKRVVVGQDRLVERAFVCLLANGHCLIEGVPGLAKTLTVATMAEVVGGQFSRIQFTPDLVPADVVGTATRRPSREEFDIEWGAVFANIVRRRDQPRSRQSPVRPARGHGRTPGLHRGPDPTRTRAVPGVGHTEPDRVRGRSMLSQAERYGFSMQVVVDHPSYQEEGVIAERMSAGKPTVSEVLSLEQLGWSATADPRRVHA